MPLLQKARNILNYTLATFANELNGFLVYLDFGQFHNLFLFYLDCLKWSELFSSLFGYWGILGAPFANKTPLLTKSQTHIQLYLGATFANELN